MNLSVEPSIEHSIEPASAARHTACTAVPLAPAQRTGLAPTAAALASRTRSSVAVAAGHIPRPALAECTRQGPTDPSAGTLVAVAAPAVVHARAAGKMHCPVAGAAAAAAAAAGTVMAALVGKARSLAAAAAVADAVADTAVVGTVWRALRRSGS